MDKDDIVELTDEITPPVIGSKDIKEVGGDVNYLFRPPSRVIFKQYPIKEEHYIKGERKEDDYKHVMKVCLPDNRIVRTAIDAAERYVEKKNGRLVCAGKCIFCVLLGALAMALITFN